MREIKFRAWHKKRKKYYEVLDLHLSNIYNGGMWATCLGFDVIEQKDIHIQIQPEDCIIEQYTGLKDKNGVEIYEGDLLKINNEEIPDVFDGNEVFYENGAFLYAYSTGDDTFGGDGCLYNLEYSDVIEIIGNIHGVK